MQGNIILCRYVLRINITYNTLHITNFINLIHMPGFRTPALKTRMKNVHRYF